MNKWTQSPSCWRLLLSIMRPCKVRHLKTLRCRRGCTNPDSRPKGKGETQQEYKGGFTGQASSKACQQHHCWELRQSLFPQPTSWSQVYGKLGGRAGNSTKVILEVILSPECVTMRLPNIHGAKICKGHLRNQMPASTLAKGLSKPKGECVDWRGQPPGTHVHSIRKCTPNSRTAGMEFSPPSPLQDNVKSGCINEDLPPTVGKSRFVPHHHQHLIFSHFQF